MSKLVALVCLAAFVGAVFADQVEQAAVVANVNANSKIYQIRNEAQAMQDDQVDKDSVIMAVPLIKPKMQDGNAFEIEPKAAIAAVDSSSISDEKNSESASQQNSLILPIVPLNKAVDSQSQSQSDEPREAGEFKGPFVVPVNSKSNSQSQSQSAEPREAGDVKGQFVVPVDSKSNSQQSQSAEPRDSLPVEGDANGPFVVPLKSNSQSQSVESDNDKSDVRGSFLVPINSQSDSQSAEPSQVQPSFVIPVDSKDTDSASQQSNSQQSAEPSDVQPQRFLIPFGDADNKPVSDDSEVDQPQQQQQQQLPMADDSVENDDDSVDQQQQQQQGMMPSLLNIQSLGQFIHQVIENHRAFVRNELGLRDGEPGPEDDGTGKQHVVMMMMRPSGGEAGDDQQGPARGVMIIKMSKSSSGLLGGPSDPDHGFAGNDESATAAAKPASLYERARNFIMRAFSGNSDSSLQQQQIENWINANGERPMDDESDEQMMMMQPRGEEEEEQQQQEAQPIPHKKCGGGGLRLFGIHSPHVYRTVLHLLFFTGVLLFVMLVTLVVLRTIKPRRSSMRHMSISSIDGGSSDFADEINDKTSTAAKSRLFLSSDLLMSGERSLMYPQAPPAYDQVIVRDATCPSQLVPAKSAVRQVSGKGSSSSSLVHSLATAYKSRLSNLLGKDVIVETRSVVSLPPDYETDEEEKAKLNAKN